MKIIVLAIGKMKPGPTLELLELYKKHLKTPLEIIEFEPKASSDFSKRIHQETTFLLSSIPPLSYVIALDERGQSLTSPDFALKLNEVRTQSYKALCFLIGGADGLSEDVRRRADLLLALGAMTWPHLLVRALITEQLYRAESILDNHPYHRE